MGSTDLIQKKIKNNKFFSLRMFAFISFLILAVIYLSNSNTIKSKLLRLLEEDIRETGENEICEKSTLFYKYDLNELKNLKKENLNLGEDIEFNFCKNIDNKDSSCIYKDTRLSGNINGEANSKNKIAIFEENEKKIIELYLAAGDECISDSNKNYKININLTCSNNESFLIYDKNFDHNSSCNLYFKAYTKHACPVETAFIRILTGVLMFILGLLVGILGYREIRIGLFIIIIVGCACLGFFLIGLFGKNSINAISIVIECVLCVCGIIIFILLIKRKKDFYARVYMLIIGGLCGFLIGQFFIYNFIFSMIKTSYQELIRTIIQVVSTLIGVALGLFLPKYTCIIGSSMIGAYLIMRGISYFLQEVVPFINEEDLYDLALSGNFDQIKDMIWGLFLIYPAMLIIFIIILIIIQIKLNPNWKEANYKDLDQLIEKPKDLSSIDYMGDIGGDDEGEEKTKE